MQHWFYGELENAGSVTEYLPKKTSRSIIFRLGSVTFSLLDNSLTDAAGLPVRLRPQSLMVLQTLAERNGEVVSKDTLIETVWPSLTVSDDSLTQCVADIRRALGDTNCTILRTAPKFGYCLNGSLVEESPDPSFATSVDPEVQSPAAMLLIAPGSENPTADEKNGFFDRVITAIRQSGAVASRTDKYV